MKAALSIFNSITPKSTNLAKINTGLNLYASPKGCVSRANITHPQTINRVSTTYVPTSTTPDPAYSPLSQTWFFDLAARELCNTTARIQLTAIESLLINTLVLSTERICSKQELIAGINKDPLAYSGLEMGLSRLQHKFRTAFDERLFRSVRNRGYCLVQDVKITH